MIRPLGVTVKRSKDPWHSLGICTHRKKIYFNLFSPCSVIFRLKLEHPKQTKLVSLLFWSFSHYSNCFRPIFFSICNHIVFQWMLEQIVLILIFAELFTNNRMNQKHLVFEFLNKIYAHQLRCDDRRWVSNVIRRFLAG